MQGELAPHNRQCMAPVHKLRAENDHLQTSRFQVLTSQAEVMRVS